MSNVLQAIAKQDTASLEQQLAALRAENEALKATKSANLRLKVSEKGALSVYGLGRFPVTLYKEQWQRLLTKVADIEAFIKANESKLSVKQ